MGVDYLDQSKEVRKENPSGLVIFGKVTNRATAFWAARKGNAFHLFQHKGEAFSPCGRELHSTDKFLPATEGIPEKVCRLCLQEANHCGIVLSRDGVVLRAYEGRLLEEYEF